VLSGVDLFGFEAPVCAGVGGCVGHEGSASDKGPVG